MSIISAPSLLFLKRNSENTEVGMRLALCLAAVPEQKQRGVLRADSICAQLNDVMFQCGDFSQSSAFGIVTIYT